MGASSSKRTLPDHIERFVDFFVETFELPQPGDRRDTVRMRAFLFRLELVTIDSEQGGYYALAAVLGEGGITG